MNTLIRNIRSIGDIRNNSSTSIFNRKSTSNGIAACLLCSALLVTAEHLTAESRASTSRLTAVSSEVYAGLPVINLNDLDQMRGGFNFGGLEVNFGATLSTLIDSVKLETVFNITSSGAQIVSQMLSNLSSVKDMVAALTQQTKVNVPAESLTASVKGPADGVTLVTETPSASQPSVPVTQPTVAPSSSLVSTAPPVIENPFAPASNQPKSIATATAGPNPTARIYTPASTTNNVPADTSNSAPAVNSNPSNLAVSNPNTVTTTTPTAIATTGPNAPSAAVSNTPAPSNIGVAALSVAPTDPQTTAVFSTTVDTTPVATATPATNAVLVGPETGVSVTDLAPMDINLNGVGNDSGFSGIVVSNHKGFTAALHKLTQDAAISAVISNASDQMVSQKLQIKIDIRNAKAAKEAQLRAQMSKIAGEFFK